MIQRIQSLYLVVITVLSVLVFFSPVVEVFNQEVKYILNYRGLVAADNASEIVINTWTITVISGIIPILSFICLFLFKNRLLQLRLCVINIVLMLGYYPLLVLNIYFALQLELSYSLHMAVSYPLISAILSYLAIRAIGRDEALVRSLNRMR